MTDEQEIEALQHAYARYFDTRDAHAFADLYTDDAVLVQIDGKEIRTKEKFVKSVVNMPLPTNGYHRILGGDIVVEGDTAHAICRFEARTTAGQDVTGHYDDSYRRTPAGWKITRRAVHID